jgi:hypothetical protein
VRVRSARPLQVLQSNGVAQMSVVKVRLVGFPELSRSVLVLVAEPMPPTRHVARVSHSRTVVADLFKVGNRARNLHPRMIRLSQWGVYNKVLIIR